MNTDTLNIEFYADFRIQPIFSFQNYEHKHRTIVFVLHVTEELAEWDDSRSIDRKRDWFTIDAALAQLALHKPVQRNYLAQLKNTKLDNVTGTGTTTTPPTMLATVATHPGGGHAQPQTTSTN